MKTFKDREKAFENKFAHDAEMQFRAAARRNRLLGLWAAERMGHKDPDAYAKEVIAADLEEAGDEDVMRKVKGDLICSGIDTSEAEVRKKMSDFLEEAKAQLATEAGL